MTDDLYNQLSIAQRSSDRIEIDTTLPAQDGTVQYVTRQFKIKAAAKGGAIGWKSVSARIVVCGSETLSLTETGSRLYEHHLIDNPITYQFPIAANFTSSDPDCPANSFVISIDE